MKNDGVIKLPKVTVERNFRLNDLNQVVDWGLKQLNVPETWQITRGEGVTVMVIDTGHPEHADLSDNIIPGKNFVPGEDIEDLNGHHSHCAGIICASDNKIGVVGVAPKAKSISVKALDKNGSGSYGYLAQALDYAIEQKPDIVSMSLGGNMPSADIESRIKKLYTMNIPVVCAAGNTGSGGVNWPAAYDETISVAAYNKWGDIAHFSSRGASVDWAAPGVDILSTYLNDEYATLSGTSMACPFLAGVIALMLSKHKKTEELTGVNDCKTVEQIRAHLDKYTMDKGTIGHDHSWGYGVVQVRDLILSDPLEHEDGILPDLPEEPVANQPGDDNPFTPDFPEPEPDEPEDNPFTPDFPEPEPDIPHPFPDAPEESPPCACPDRCTWPRTCPPCPDIDQPVTPAEPKKSKKTLWIALGVGAIILIGVLASVLTTPPNERRGYLEDLPYVDEDGNVDWDKKYDLDPNK